MIKNIEKEKDVLSRFEQENLLPKVIDILENRRGISKIITSTKIKNILGSANNDATIRKVVNYIRNHCLIPCLIATSRGYYIAASAKDIADYDERVRGRVRAIHKMRQSVHNQGVLAYGEEAIKAAEEELKNEKKMKYKLSLKLKRERTKKKKRKPVLRLKLSKPKFY